MNIYNHKLKLPIGNTPLINIYDNIFLKLEQYNFGGSIKSRVALEMIKKLLHEKKINKNTVILEASGGNTGMGLAILSKYFQYKVVLVIPDNYSIQKINLLRALGAKVILSNHTLGNNSHIILAQKIAKKYPNYIYTDQLSNFANVEAHYNTGNEIIANNINLDFFVSGIGSGGTITGIGQTLKKHNKNIKIIGVLPQGYSIENEKFISHNIQGTGIGMIPKILDKNIIDDYIEISELEIIATAKKIMDGYGLFLGLSSLANIAATIKLSENYNNKNILTISPDAGYDYDDFYNNLWGGKVINMCSIKKQIYHEIVELYNSFSIDKHIETNLIEIIYEDLVSVVSKDASIASNEEAYFAHFGFKSIMYYRISNNLYNSSDKDNQIKARLISEHSKVLTGIEIHPEATIGRRTIVDHGCGTVIGQTCQIGDDCYILNGVILGAKKITDYRKNFSRHPIIGNNVEIGSNVKIFGNTKVGNNVFISPNITITKNIPDDTQLIKKTDYILKKKRCNNYA